MNWGMTQLGAMSFGPGGVLQITLATAKSDRNVTVCPQNIRPKIMWDTNRMVHTGIGGTLKRQQLTWYWPGMTADIRRLVRACEVCQAAKLSNKTPVAGKR